MTSLLQLLGRTRRWWRPLAQGVLLACLVMLVAGAVVALQSLRAKGDLRTASAQLEVAQRAVQLADTSTAVKALDGAREAASRARGRTTGAWSPAWSLAERLPVAGAVVQEVHGVISETDVVTGQVLPPLVDSVTGQARQWRGRVDVVALARVAPRLRRAETELDAVRRRVAGLPSGGVPFVADARQDLAVALSELAANVQEASVASQVLPRLLGAQRPGRLLVVAQNLAEARATGGLIGAYAILRTDRGSFRIERSGPGSELHDADKPVVKLGMEFAARYGRAEAASTWRSANLTPDTPTAGAILAGLSAAKLHVRVDGVLFVDPVALARVLGATGPVPLRKVHLTADNAVRLLLHDTYEIYRGAADNAKRDAVFQEALVNVVEVLRRPGFATGPLLAGLRAAARSGHLQLYSARAADEGALRRAVFGGALPLASPFLSVITQDVGGSKLDYYLTRTVWYDARPTPGAVDVGAGPQRQEAATVTVRLHSTAPSSGLPEYVTTRADLPGRTAHPVGQLRSWVSVYLGRGGSYSRATLNGRPVALSSHTEQGLAVFSTFVDVDPGTTVTLVLQVEQPAVPGSTLLWRQQPRLRPDDLTVWRVGPSPSFVSSYRFGGQG